ncbi:hypothetical protein [Mucilaginibacter ginsenosidivorax]|nr:hypothetical protein [Mucilaginibacter ginsenosidivorax]
MKTIVNLSLIALASITLTACAKSGTPAPTKKLPSASPLSKRDTTIVT